jgi:hypothetical protein
VSHIRVEDDSISFDVDQVGVPVLVKMSYFPNWQVSGAAGPYRVAPNFMVVVPDDTHVELTYGRTGVEWFSYGLTALGLVGLALIARRGAYRFSPARRAAQRPPSPPDSTWPPFSPQASATESQPSPTPPPPSSPPPPAPPPPDG